MAALFIDLVNQTLNNNNIVPKTWTVTTQGSAADYSNAEVSMNALIQVGAFSAAVNTSIYVQIEECATTNGTYTAIPGMAAAVTTTNQLIPLRGLRTQQYVRANLVTATGTTPSVSLGVTLISQLKYSGSNTGGGASRAPST